MQRPTPPRHADVTPALYASISERLAKETRILTLFDCNARRVLIENFLNDVAMILSEEATYLPTGNDEIFAAVDYLDSAIGVHDRQIARIEASTAKCLLSRVWITEILG